MENKNRCRAEIESLIEKDDLRGLLNKASELHGHLCNYLVYGVIAGHYGLKKLGVKNTGMEEIIVILETNNCFSDGIQVVTGCSFGNNALIYRDFGKTAVTLSRRDGKAIRLSMKPEYDDEIGNRYPEPYSLFDKLITKREKGSPEEFGRMMSLFAKMASEEIDIPAETIFKIEELNIDLPEFAPIFESIKCSVCGENIMKSRAIEKNDNFYCIPCSKTQYYELNGAGIIHKNL